MKKLCHTEIRPGTILPWPIYDHAGHLLLNKGQRIESVAQSESLLARGLYRGWLPGERELAELELQQQAFTVPLADRSDELRDRLKQIFKLLLLPHNPERPAEPRVRRLAQMLQELCDFDNDAAIAAVHLFLNRNYYLDHPLHAALLITLLSQQLNLDQAARESLVCAALTHDIGILQLQQQLDKQSTPLSETQRIEVNQHPGKGVQRLQLHEINDPIWLDAVLHHHERLDGSGYPDSVAGDALSLYARMLAITDMYSAMVRPRAHRGAIESRQTLRTLFMERGATIDEHLTSLLVSTLGLYPPGTLLRLDNGEIGLVVRRGDKASEPLIHVVINQQGHPLALPRPIDGQKIKEVVSIQRYRSVLSLVEQFYCDIARSSR